VTGTIALKARPLGTPLIGDLPGCIVITATPQPPLYVELKIKTRPKMTAGNYLK
jgi:hypothetical protein